ncbi:MAG: hypothetical protein PVF45_00170, partial [Anaerolineae bacterium]
MQVTATVTATTIYGGDWATWQVTVTNSGDDPLTGVTLDDSNGHDYGLPFDLDVGAGKGFSYTTIPNASVTNEVTAVGSDSVGGTVGDSDQTTVNVINPGIQ